VNSSFAKVFKKKDVVVLYSGINVWELGYPLSYYPGYIAYTANDPDISICSNGGCLAYISTDPTSPFNYYNLTVGDTTYYGAPIEQNYEIAKLDGITYLLYLKKIHDAWSTNDTILWRGANPYVVLTPMPDVNYTSISFNFNSSSGTYD